eukprot:scaffold64204_cov63-Phaeocystis_antarctica.AAC.1
MWGISREQIGSRSFLAGCHRVSKNAIVPPRLSSKLTIAFLTRTASGSLIWCLLASFPSPSSLLNWTLVSMWHASNKASSSLRPVRSSLVNMLRISSPSSISRDADEREAATAATAGSSTGPAPKTAWGRGAAAGRPAGRGAAAGWPFYTHSQITRGGARSSDSKRRSSDFRHFICLQTDIIAASLMASGHSTSPRVRWVTHGQCRATCERVSVPIPVLWRSSFVSDGHASSHRTNPESLVISAISKFKVRMPGHAEQQMSRLAASRRWLHRSRFVTARQPRRVARTAASLEVREHLLEPYQLNVRSRWVRLGKCVDQMISPHSLRGMSKRLIDGQCSPAARYTASSALSGPTDSRMHSTSREGKHLSTSTKPSRVSRARPSSWSLTRFGQRWANVISTASGISRSIR